MTFNTVYEISVLNPTVLEGLGFFLIGLLVGGIGLKTEKGAKRTFCLMWALAWCSICGLWFFGSLRLSYRYVQMLRNQKANVTEGVVKVEHVQPSEGHHAFGDQVRIGDRAFEINFYSTKVGYTKSIHHGGRLREGVYARIYYRGDDIIRIDIGHP